MSDVSDVVGAAAAGANPLTAIVSLGKDLIDRFIPDPAAKAQASLQLAEMQQQLTLAQLDATQKELASAAPANDDHYMAGVRATFGYVMIALYLWNYGVGPAFKASTVQIPVNVNVMFAVLIMGFIGVPAGIEMAKTIAGMPGDSSVSVLGGLARVGNKS